MNERNVKLQPQWRPAQALWMSHISSRNNHSHYHSDSKQIEDESAARMDDDEYEIPLRDQRYFRAGIKRKRVKFVSSTSNEAAVQSLPTTPSKSASDAYLSIVFGKPVEALRATSAPPAPDNSIADLDVAQSEATFDNAAPIARCAICSLPIQSMDTEARHESSIAHQICLEHSHPPSHVDRRRKGLAVLEGQGWDPDSRRGLGTEGAGILHPVKAKENPNRAGLGVPKQQLPVKVQSEPKLDAGKVRLLEVEGKKKAEKLRNAFYRSEDVERYLGEEGEINQSLDLAAFTRAKRR